jgi:hypothetical protein
MLGSASTATTLRIDRPVLRRVIAVAQYCAVGGISPPNASSPQAT